MPRGLALVFSVVAYAAFVAAFAALADFVFGVGLVRGIDAGPSASVPVAIGVDLALVALFGVSHSVMARPAFKARWTRVVPQVLERSVYVLVSSVALGALVWHWRAIPARVWSVEAPALRALVWGVSVAGLVLAVLATFFTNHFDFFGLRQGWLYARGRPYTPVAFQERGLYKVVRHPMMVGLLAWMWAAPTMSVGHLLFAASMTMYIVVGVSLEERELLRTLGEPYDRYRKRVRALLPIRR